MRFSANLGFLWNDRPLPDAIHAAKAAGFDAVECHWPYDIPAQDVRTALDATGLPMLGLNTSRGDVAGGENGLAALPGRTDDARAAIDQAIAYADIVDAGAIHVMCGFASGAEAHTTFIENLRYAYAATPRTILIEPLNRHDAPGYFLQSTDQARAIIAQVDAPNLKLMFDCYHVGRTEGDILTRITDLGDLIGHIQFASVPDRGAPDHGELDYATIFAALQDWPRPLGAEYKPVGDTDTTLAWMQHYR
ncbi:hydroxypyruvate isomerase [Tateyamaria omphalii]|uniref:hydroxypyruvate isomerase family protein n=1 Tax=Tateyamaria omphalii TaxID=299262 RepID=UPI00167AFC08|nr:TIM barrel protein [Tateyamaria omphalii]GGX48788.1 hydroxypyruvate isomerase [Tateyamaria omphalii]